MNKFILAALLLAGYHHHHQAAVTAAVVYDPVDDPRCHDEPSRPVLEPTPGPTPYPPPPGQMREYTPPATTPPPPEVPCTGEVTGFQIYDLDTGDTIDLVDGQVVGLATMPASFTVKAVTSSDSLSSVELYYQDALYAQDTTAPYLFGETNFLELNTEGTFTLKAVGPTDTPGVTCSITFEVTYGNPHNCEGIIQQFALYDTDAQAIVEGYSLLEDNEVLVISDLPENLSIIAIDNGRGNGVVKFGYGNDFDYFETSDTPAAISGTDGNGNVLPWEILKQTEFITISAFSSDALGQAESRMCQISLQIEPDWACPYTVSGFQIQYAKTHTAVPGYENVLGYRAIDLNEITAPDGLSIVAHSSSGGVEFFLNGDYVRTENYGPYAINGDNSGGVHEYDVLRETGQFVIEARHKNENSSKNCQLVLTIQRDYAMETIDNPDFCAPEQVVPETVGNLMFHDYPVAIVSRVTDEYVTFKTVQNIKDDTLDWVTTVFVTGAGYEVCDKIDSMSFGAESTHEYEAKCFEGFAYADIYASSSGFSSTEATADTTFLHPGCKTADSTKVVKYTFVFPCNCDTQPDVPDEFIGGPNKKQQTCTGITGYSWGDPHIIPYGGSRSNGWNCQGEGEFVLAKATLMDYPYDFAAHARFTMFGQDLPWTFNSGVSLEQDVTVQISMGVIGEADAKPNMMDNVPIYFYVDGVPRYFHEGTGDLRVTVYTSGFHVYVTFVETGIQAHVQVRPFQSDHHSGIMGNRDAEIPGSFSTYICLPSENDKIVNVMGLLGTPTTTNDFSDDFMLKDGTPIAKPSDLLAYCEDEWCITDPSESLFTFETGYDFSTYNKCGVRRRGRRRHLEVATSDCVGDCLTICDKVDMDLFCIEEWVACGTPCAEAAVLSIVNGQQIVRDSQASLQPDDARCCSSDYKHCAEGCTQQNGHFCDTCGEGLVFFPRGPYATTLGDFHDCVALDGPVSGTQTCCPGLEAVDGSCQVDERGRRRRRQLLSWQQQEEEEEEEEAFTFSRPGVVDPNNRKTVLFRPADEL